MSLPVSPLAPAAFGDLPTVAGLQAYAGRAGAGYRGRDHILLVRFDAMASVAGVLTTSRCPSAAVDWCRDRLETGLAQALVVNAGNANAFTGGRGAEAAASIASQAGLLTGCPSEAVMMASTGVIGEPLDPGPINAALTVMADTEPVGWEEAARAIGTTDTFPKGAGETILIEDKEVHIAGIAKGSGMIAPDMATMLAFIFTDLDIAPAALRPLVAEAAQASFNAITVDGDTSTSDTCLVFATGAAEPARVDDHSDPRLEGFALALRRVMQDLALQIVRDGEGASKLITVGVTGATDVASARRIAFSVANSPLVKTAIAGEDANWGRVVMAVGKAGEPADRDRLRISFGEIVVAENGARASDYDETALSRYMRNETIAIAIDVGVGEGAFTAHTCDLTHGYISINGDYRS